MDPGKPDIQLVKDLAVGNSRRAKQFSFGDFKKANVRAIGNNSRRINVAPAHAFFDGEFLELIHQFIVSLIQ